MLDIFSIEDGQDLIMRNSVVPRAANIISVQLGSLEYAPTFGVDLTFFLESEIRFQKESFKAYLIQRLTEEQINVASVLDTVEALMQRLNFSVGEITGGAS